MSVGIYISVPFCRTKCSFCNFASDVVSKAAFTRYVDRVIADITAADSFAHTLGAQWGDTVDSIYLGGGTPTVLEGEQLVRVFDAVRRKFHIEPDAEITVECAPGTLTGSMLDALLRCGVNRVSLGVQSFVDEESRSVGRLHTRAVTLDDIAHLRSAGITNLSIDLIAGLPHQTTESWEFSLSETIASGLPHASVYMLEVDDESRLGRELIAGGTRYHAHFVPDDDTTADFYTRACDCLNSAGITQYEISNFGRHGCESRHNLKYWTRSPYLGFGVDAHSMLLADPSLSRARTIRFATPDTLEAFMSDKPATVSEIGPDAALEEEFFLGLRLNDGIDPEVILRDCHEASKAEMESAISELSALELLERRGPRIRLTARGRLLSNEVFERFIAPSPHVR
jgi:oxygen-independent coproporphyrinogen-3 oxidase